MEENKKEHKLVKNIIIGFCGIYTLLILGVIIMPKKFTLHVDDVSWKSKIDIEDYIAEIKEGDHVPFNAKFIGEYDELVGHEPVLTSIKQTKKTIKVNTETGSKDITYTTEEPVYSNKPIYTKKFVYEQSSWKKSRSIEETGNDTEPFYGNVTLTGTEREKDKSIDFYVTGQASYKEYLLGDYKTFNKTYTINKKAAENIKPGQDIVVWVKNNKVLFWKLV